MTPEQDELVSTVRSVLAKRADSVAVRAAIDSPEGYDVSLWRLLCDQIGVAALAIPEEYDGAGATLVEACLVLEELGYSLAPSPLLANVIVGQALLAADLTGAPDLLARVGAGEVAALRLTNRLVSSGDTLVLEGADATILIGERDGRLVSVDPHTARREAAPTMDQSLRLARVDLEGATLTDLGPAEPALGDARLVALVGIAALQAGVARRGLDMTVAYSKERVQFGRPIGSFQALKHRMADLLVLVEMSRSAYLAAVQALADGDPDAAEHASIAKSYCGDALNRVASETVQLHGGIGVTWEHDAQLVFKRAHALNQLFGAAHEHRSSLTL
jgi:alkylation response protein AidB-like acyl-CoA dehydrogenase